MNIPYTPPTCSASAPHPPISTLWYENESLRFQNERLTIEMDKLQQQMQTLRNRTSRKLRVDSQTGIFF